MYAHNLEGAERLAKLMTGGGDLASTRSLGNVGLMLIMLGQGRVHQAGVYGEGAIHPVPWSRLVPSPHFLGLGLTKIDSGAVSALRERLMDWNAPVLLSAPDRQVSYEQFRDHQRRYLIGLLSVRLGDKAAALTAARALDTMQTVADGRGLRQMFATAIRADLLLSSGKPSEALRLLEKSDAKVPIELGSPFGVEAYSGWLRAESLRRLGRDREALGWYASRVDLFMVELPFLGAAELRQGELYDRLGDKPRAIEHYRRFVALWRNADAELQATVQGARTRLAALEPKAMSVAGGVQLQ